MGERATPLFFPKLFLTTDIMKVVKKETNRYARTVCTEMRRTRQLSPRSMYVKWLPVTRDELWCFLAVCLHMGQVKKPKMSDYWSKSPSLNSTFCRSLMSFQRFRFILSMLHLNDNATFVPRGQAGHDPLHKVKPVYNHLRKVFKEVLVPERRIAIDEAMCPWRGRASMRVYMKDKPQRWGIKLYELCESSSGYVWDFEIYAMVPGVSNKPFDVVHRLIEPLKQKGYIVYFDNYYCNPQLCLSLAADGTNSVGVARANRVGMPSELVQTPLQVREVDYRRQGVLLAIKWRDKKDVHTLTTVHKPKMRMVRSRSQRKMKPVATQDYILHMAGVDKSDQLLSYQPMHRRTLKWWKKLFFHLLTLVVIQSHVLHNKYLKSRRRKIWKLDKFFKALTEEVALVSNPARAIAAAEATREAGPSDVTRLNQPHYPDYLPPTEKKARPTKNCKLCYLRSSKSGTTASASPEPAFRRKQTSFWCPDCQVPLCVHPCFRDWHTLKILK